LLQSDRNATLLIDVLRSYVAARQFDVHAGPRTSAEQSGRRHDH
jgi:hypothetical protein